MAKVYDNPEHYDNGKMTPKEWIGHIWYHYKWPIMSVAFIVVFLGITISQLLSKSNPDISILHVGPSYLTRNVQSSIVETVQTMSEDYNGDGKVKVNIVDITVEKIGDVNGDNLQNFDDNNEGHKRFRVEILTGESIIYLLDEEFFDECVSKELLAPLSDVIDDAYMPENVIDGYGVRISDLDAFELKGFKNIPETAILCLRRQPKQGEIKWGKGEEHWENNKNTFVNIIKYRNTDEN